MRIAAVPTTVVPETVGRFQQEQAIAAEARLARSLGGKDAQRLREAADQIVGTTFFGSLLKQAQDSQRRDGYFAPNGAERFFTRQLHLELVRRASVSGRLNLGSVLTAGLTDHAEEAIGSE